jgi:4-hydroxy-tetrahydrodipicolinate synthase
MPAGTPNITAIKEAGGSVDRVNQLVQAVPEGFGILCGDDPLTLPFIACGACGLGMAVSSLTVGDPGLDDEKIATILGAKEETE